MKKKLVEGIDFYYENGLIVLTEKYHLEKGYCCGNGCRHCPYSYDAVQEPDKTQLLQQRENVLKEQLALSNTSVPEVKDKN